MSEREPAGREAVTPERQRRERPRAARRITPRDEQLLAWLARQRFATAPQIAARFGIGVNRCARRLGELAAAGLVDRQQPFLAPSVYLVTPAGLGVADSGLPPPRLDLRTFRHDRGVTELVVAFELQGERLVTEREMRSAEASGETRYSARLVDTAADLPRRHFPDLVLVRAGGGAVAVELELTSKRTRRLKAILRAYRRATNIGSVVYYSDNATLRRRIEQLAAELHLDGRLEVRRWEAR